MPARRLGRTSRSKTIVGAGIIIAAAADGAAARGAAERGAGAAQAGRLRQWREGLAGIGLVGAAPDDANVGYTVGGATGQAGRGVGAEGEVVLMDAAAARAWLEHGDEA